LQETYENIHKIPEYALQREYGSKTFFENDAERLSNAAAKGTFKAIVKEEQRHDEAFEKYAEMP
jgi:rubrerythrin